MPPEFYSADMLFDISEFTAPAGRANGNKDLFAEKTRAAWHSQNKKEARCDFAPDRWRLNSRGIFFISLWKASIYGRTLTEIKADDEMPDFFAKNISDFITRFFNNSASSARNFEDWALITPPPRRHLEHNFAIRTAKLISELSGFPFIPDTAKAKNRQRVMAEFELINLPKAGNILCFDDIVTTGSTFQAMNRILAPYNKNIIFLTAINNKL